MYIYMFTLLPLNSLIYVSLMISGELGFNDLHCSGLPRAVCQNSINLSEVILPSACRILITPEFFDKTSV